MKEDEKDWACSMHGEIINAYKHQSKSLKERYRLVDVGVHGLILLKWILKKHCEGVDWIRLTQDTDQW
jgi:hypothetical protein